MASTVQHREKYRATAKPIRDSVLQFDDSATRLAIEQLHLLRVQSNAKRLAFLHQGVKLRHQHLPSWHSGRGCDIPDSLGHVHQPYGLPHAGGRLRRCHIARH
jgi:hypothetical protein